MCQKCLQIFQNCKWWKFHFAKSWKAELRKVKADQTTKTTVAQTDVSIKNLEDMQSINAQNMEETLRIQREEAQRSQKLQTETNFIGTHNLNQQTDVLKTGAASLGNMGDMGGGGGMNPAGMMTGMMRLSIRATLLRAIRATCKLNGPGSMQKVPSATRLGAARRPRAGGGPGPEADLGPLLELQRRRRLSSQAPSAGTSIRARAPARPAVSPTDAPSATNRATPRGTAIPRPLRRRTSTPTRVSPRARASSARPLDRRHQRRTSSTVRRRSLLACLQARLLSPRRLRATPRRLRTPSSFRQVLL